VKHTNDTKFDTPVEVEVDKPLSHNWKNRYVLLRSPSTRKEHNAIGTITAEGIRYDGNTVPALETATV